MATLRSVFKEFYVGFDFFVTRHTTEHRSLVHLTVGANSGRYGDRIPGIWLDESNELWVISSINDNYEYRYIHNIPIKMGQWYKVEVEQVLVEEKVRGI